MQAAREPYKPHVRDAYYYLNLRPKPPEAPVKQVKPVKQDRVAPAIDKLNVIAILILSGILCISFVVSSVYANEIQRTINRTVISTQNLYVEIDDLDVKINEGLDISTIENRAVSELGMVYPATEQFVFIKRFPKIANFAQYIRENAYDPFDGAPLTAIPRYEETGAVY